MDYFALFCKITVDAMTLSNCKIMLCSRNYSCVGSGSSSSSNSNSNSCSSGSIVEVVVVLVVVVGGRAGPSLPPPPPTTTLSAAVRNNGRGACLRTVSAAVLCFPTF